MSRYIPADTDRVQTDPGDLTAGQARALARRQAKREVRAELQRRREAGMRLRQAERLRRVRGGNQEETT